MDKRTITAARYRVPIIIPIFAALVMSACAVDSSAELPAWQEQAPDAYRAAVLEAGHRLDTSMLLYRAAEARPDVIAFYTAIVHSADIAQIILEQAEAFDVPPSLAMALCWVESRFDPKALNKNKASIDRGLFQLNSKSFPKLTEADFFDPELNARNGLAHLRWCLDLAGSEVAGLAMYNAGTNRVRADSTPKATLDYVDQILAFRDGVDQLFDRDLAVRWVIAGNGMVSPAVTQLASAPRLFAAAWPLTANP